MQAHTHSLYDITTDAMEQYPNVRYEIFHIIPESFEHFFQQLQHIYITQNEEILKQVASRLKEIGQQYRSIWVLNALMDIAFEKIHRFFEIQKRIHFYAIDMSGFLRDWEDRLWKEDRKKDHRFKSRVIIYTLKIFLDENVGPPRIPYFTPINQMDHLGQSHAKYQAQYSYLRRDDPHAEDPNAGNPNAENPDAEDPHADDPPPPPEAYLPAYQINLQKQAGYSDQEVGPQAIQITFEDFSCQERGELRLGKSSELFWPEKQAEMQQLQSNVKEKRMRESQQKSIHKNLVEYQSETVQTREEDEDEEYFLRAQYQNIASIIVNSDYQLIKKRLD